MQKRGVREKKTAQWKRHVGWCFLLAGFMVEGGMATAISSVQSIRIEHVAPYFSPNSVTVRAGAMIRWENETGEIHTIIDDECVRGSPCRFDSGMIRPHGTFDLPPLPPGHYAYHCGLHPFMRGTITVVQPKTRRLDI